MAQQYFKYVQKIRMSKFWDNADNNTYECSRCTEYFIDLLLNDIADGNKTILQKFQSLLKYIESSDYYQIVPAKFLYEFAKQLDLDAELDIERQQKKQTIPVFFNNKYNTTLAILMNVNMSDTESVDVEKLIKLIYDRIKSYINTDPAEFVKMAAEEYYAFSKDKDVMYLKADSLTSQEYIDIIISKIVLSYFMFMIGDIHYTLAYINLSSQFFSEDEISIIHSFKREKIDVANSKQESVPPIEEEIDKIEENPKPMNCLIQYEDDSFIYEVCKQLCDRLVNDYDANKLFIRYLLYYSRLKYDYNVSQNSELVALYKSKHSALLNYINSDRDKNISIIVNLLYKRLTEYAYSNAGLYENLIKFYHNTTLSNRSNLKTLFYNLYYNGAAGVLLQNINIISNILIDRIKDR